MARLSWSVLTLMVVAGAVAAVQQPGDKKPDAPKAAAPAKGEADKKKEKEKEKVPALKVGDAAPAIKVDAWVKGEEVKSFEAGKVYVVEFWATWHAGCTPAIPQLTKVQRERAEVTVIGVAAMERIAADKEGKPAPDTRLEGVREFVKKMGKDMEYRVAYDGSRAMLREWMAAAEKDAIPMAFIVGHEGKIAYIGPPADMDAAINKAIKAATDAKEPAAK